MAAQGQGSGARDGALWVALALGASEVGGLNTAIVLLLLCSGANLEFCVNADAC